MREYIQYSRIFHTFAWNKISRRKSLPHYAVQPKFPPDRPGHPLPVRTLPGPYRKSGKKADFLCRISDTAWDPMENIF